MLILDLDDTIFETKSMSSDIFDEPISVLRSYYSQQPDNNTDYIINELWTNPIDYVLAKYDTPSSIVEDFYNKIVEIDYRGLDIQPHSDYQTIREIDLPKILVTTGLKELQWAKIKALGIEEDFLSIHIDDPRENPRRSKSVIFSQIIIESDLQPKDVIVIGDNPDSELRAGNDLGMTTVQRQSESKSRGKEVDYYIEDFGELLSLPFFML